MHRTIGSKFALDNNRSYYKSSQFSHKQLVLVATPVYTGVYFFIDPSRFYTELLFPITLLIFIYLEFKADQQSLSMPYSYSAHKSFDRDKISYKTPGSICKNVSDIKWTKWDKIFLHQFHNNAIKKTKYHDLEEDLSDIILTIFFFWICFVP